MPCLIIFSYFLKFIFNIITLKQSKNTKKIIFKNISDLQVHLKTIFFSLAILKKLPGKQTVFYPGKTSDLQVQLKIETTKRKSSL